MSFPNLLGTSYHVYRVRDILSLRVKMLMAVSPWVGYRTLVEVGLTVKFNEPLTED